MFFSIDVLHLAIKMSTFFIFKNVNQTDSPQRFMLYVLLNIIPC